jgi:RimJ/RimL family protein N-acetyltransferase
LDIDKSKLRVFLRALDLEDYKSSLQWRRDDEIWDMVVGRKYYVSEEYERRWVARIAEGTPNDVKLAICTRVDQKYVGNIYLTDIDFFNRHASSSILIGDKDYWGNGYATEAMLLILHHAFFELGLERIEARQLLSNQASIKLHQKCGYKVEGTLRKVVFKNGQLVDLNVMACLRNDFLEVLEHWKTRLQNQTTLTQQPAE